MLAKIVISNSGQSNPVYNNVQLHYDKKQIKMIETVQQKLYIVSLNIAIE